MRKAFEMMAAARPASGMAPTSEAEWARAHRAVQELVFAMIADSGVEPSRARALSRVCSELPIGRKLLEQAYSRIDKQDDPQ